MARVIPAAQANPTPFWKVEGLENDFVLLDRSHTSTAEAEALLPLLAELAPSLCHRRRGIGADGILIVGPGSSKQADGQMWVINHDGSRPEMCGNGLRCVALHLAQRRSGAELAPLTIDTDAGSRPCEIEPQEHRAGFAVVSVSMGQALNQGLVRPELGAGRQLRRVSTGNPHAVCFVDSGEDPEALARELGPGLETSPEFPGGTNVEFARQLPDGSLQLWVWERGCGITQACGTGACATVFAAHHDLGLELGSQTRVKLPGGDLLIGLPATPDGDITMAGPARHVFQGTLDLPSPTHTRGEIT